MKLHSISKSRLPVLWIEYFLFKAISEQWGTRINTIWERYKRKTIRDSMSLPQFEIFKKNPDVFFESMAIVLRSYSVSQKGILLIKYSYSFSLFLAMFDVNLVMKHYHIVLEPSWTGYCDGSILSYSGLPCPVFVQSLEPKDSDLLLNISKNLFPVEIGSNWWVDHRIFRLY